jgi:hypothetical protein
MNRVPRRSGPTSVTVLALVVGAAGIAILWGAGQSFPFYPPPGIIILLAGAFVVGLGRSGWSPGVGALLGLFVVVGFLVEGFVTGDGFSNLVADEGAGRAVGQAVQLIGVVTAVVSGAIAVRVNHRSLAVSDEEYRQ